MSDDKIHVIIPNWNNGGPDRWIIRCLESVQAQEYDNWSAVVVDDCSSDDSYDLIEQWCENRSQWTWYQTPTNQKCPRNLWEAIKVANPAPQDVIYLLDGDDFLPHNQVLTRIAEIFRDPYIWLTYGNYSVDPYNTGQVPASMFPWPIVNARAFRPLMRQLFNHPLVFRAGLWNHLTEADMQDSSGEWFDIGYDKIIMLPMLELATPWPQQGFPHWRFIDEDLYRYNAINPLSDVNHPVPATQQKVYEIWSRPVKEPLHEI